ncbi:MAG: hypothetical protein GYB55_10885 [Cytophagales bacterium]|uniref:hypothetical protein n=1 Tax=Cyclobacterium marinum TaxID=104 RepID=UPI0011ED0DB4|nr:hypothetical protein [Cyclobacterium marinum]MBI0400328.1 hypothetical protein [Cyclobacterium marinum]MBR9775483.1 hypothetical protein [Cytophagales bacterium]|tara:strand:- start:91162 stop:91632 length:471 start_codon:yes stop_codon:yes gene_type:complete
MNRFSIVILSILFSICPFLTQGQVSSGYQVLKTNNAFIIKPYAIDFTRIDTEGMSLECSTTNLSNELNFSHISSYFDEDTQILFRNIKIQARVYIDISGTIQNLYFISENDPENYSIDFNGLATTIKRKLKIEQNKECLTKMEDKYISWYIPLFQY